MARSLFSLLFFTLLYFSYLDLAIVRYLEVWRYFLKGTTIKFEIWTDHKNLKYFIKIQKLDYRQARWALYLLTLH